MRVLIVGARREGEPGVIALWIRLPRSLQCHHPPLTVWAAGWRAGQHSGESFLPHLAAHMHVPR